MCKAHEVEGCQNEERASAVGASLESRGVGMCREETISKHIAIFGM
jgi:hypothetical protein